MSILTMGLGALFIILTIVNHKFPEHMTLAPIMIDTPGITALISAIAAILIVGHEYRHNTIAYTLAASRSRAKILLAKAAVATFFSIALAFATLAVVLICFYVGLSIRGVESLPTPNAESFEYLLRGVLFAVGMTLLSLVITMLVRSIVFAIVAFFMIPTIEGFLSILLKDKTAYLPATALDQINYTGPDPMLSPLQGGLVFLAYLTVSGIVAWYLFTKRDAN